MEFPRHGIAGRSEDPVTQTLVDGGQRQHGDGQQEVAQRKVADEKVGDVTQRAESHQSHADEQVAQHRGNDDQQQRQRHDAQLGLVVVDRQQNGRRASLSASRRHVDVIAVAAAAVGAGRSVISRHDT